MDWEYKQDHTGQDTHRRRKGDKEWIEIKLEPYKEHKYEPKYQLCRYCRMRRMDGSMSLRYWCSQECAEADRHGDPKPGEDPIIVPDRLCAVCGRDIPGHKKSGTKHCSKACGYEAQKQKQREAYGQVA